ncbi:hypothetical protein PanWU01x14_294370, partial [Parasponia andersonii]
MRFEAFGEEWGVERGGENGDLDVSLQRAWPCRGWATCSLAPLEVKKRTWRWWVVSVVMVVMNGDSFGLRLERWRRKESMGMGFDALKLNELVKSTLTDLFLSFSVITRRMEVIDLFCN